MKLAFLGAGKMATAIAAGVVNEGVLPAGDLAACDVNPAAREAFTDKTGVLCGDFDPALFRDCEVLLLAVKPQAAEAAAAAVPPLRPDQLVVSIAAGIPLSRLGQWFGTDRIIRTMPNTPLMVGKGATVFSRGAGATKADAAFARSVFGALGCVFELPEEQMDAVTALSGSGPAYVFEMIQALVDAAAEAGLAADLALGLTVQTVAGAAEMLSRNLGTPDELRVAVTSHGGTTAAGLAVMGEWRFREMIRRTILAARDRSVELGA